MSVNMRYFTPELLLKLNSSDSEIVDEATEHWEEAILAYRRHLRRLHSEMPLEFQPITNLSLHDWKLVGIWHGSGQKGGTVILMLGNGAEIMLLWYRLSGKLRRSDVPEGWSCATDHVDWLYDEVDFDTENHKSFVHRMLFSDGTTLVVPSSQCHVMSAHSRRAVSHSDLMQIA